MKDVGNLAPRGGLFVCLFLLRKWLLNAEIVEVEGV